MVLSDIVFDDCIFLMVKKVSELLHMPLYVCALIGWFLLSIFIMLIDGDKVLAVYKFEWLFPFFLVGYVVAEKKPKFHFLNTYVSIVLVISYFMVVVYALSKYLLHRIGIYRKVMGERKLF